MRGLTETFADVIAANRDQPRRASSVAWRLLDAHRAFVRGIAEAVQKRAAGDDFGAFEAQERLMREFSEREIALERYFDLYMFWQAYKLAGFFVKPEKFKEEHHAV